MHLSSLYFKLLWQSLTILHLFSTDFTVTEFVPFFSYPSNFVTFILFLLHVQQTRPLPSLMAWFHTDKQNWQKHFQNDWFQPTLTKSF